MAKLTLDESHAQKLAEYVKHLRPKAITESDPGNLFVLPGLKAMVKWSNVESYLKVKLGTSIPTSTEARKIGTTLAVRTLDTQSNSLINSQMSHQDSVAQRYYSCTTGSADAAKAFKLLETLRVKKGSTSSSSSCFEESLLKKKYTPWGKEESVYIESIFKKYIIADSPAP